MSKLYIEELINRIEKTVAAHRLESTGEYARWLQNDKNGSRELGINEYGCADAANLLYTINRFISEPTERQCWINVLQGLQNPNTGLFTESTHHYIHTTAHCVAALELFDASPLYKLKALEMYATVEGIKTLLEGLDWVDNPWGQSHQGAGIFAALVLTNMVGKDWIDDYFKWMWNESDPESGLWRKGCVKKDSTPLYVHMASSFHYLFNHEYEKMPLRYPERMIDSCLELRENTFGNQIGFLAVDWVYCLNRAGRQCDYRYDEIKQTLRKFAAEFIDYLYSLDYKTDDGFNDLHNLFGSTCALAELQQALPGEIRTDKPLRLTLDRRPFI